MQKILQLKEKIKNITSFVWNNKRYRYGAIALIIIALIVISKTNKDSGLITETVTVKDLHQTVLASGQVTSVTDLSLSFTTSGMIKKVNVAVGDKVKQGQVLANLEQGTEYAQVLSAKAKYQKLLEGATSEEINVKKTALTNAKIDLANTIRQQAVLVKNAYQKLLNTDLTPSITSGTISGYLPTISGTYTGDKEGFYDITTLSSGAGGYFQTSGIENATGNISTTNLVALGTKGLYIKFPTGYTPTGNDHWILSLPNKQSASYITNYNAYTSAQETGSSAVANAQAVVDARQADYDLEIAGARNTDLLLAQSDVLSAEANFEKTVIRAPASGTVTAVRFKVGEHVQALSEAIVLQDIDNLYVEGDVNESRVSTLQIGQPVAITFDGLGPEQKFTGSVLSIDPGATVQDGIANYKVKVALNEKSPLIRPGMNATFTITIASKQGVVVVPESALIKKDAGTFVSIAEGKNEHKEIPVTVGMKGDGNLVEITSGLQAGDTIVINSSLIK
ncbi:MAG: efflux RND transporter periplasmic adaptor subunit [bacterium]